jgi:quercetin dioxygenase-like cupin family protein
MTTISHPTSTPYLVRAHEGERIWIVGDTMWTKASAEATGGSQSVLEFEAIPGGGPPPHIHSNEDESLYVIDGEFEFLIGEQTLLAGPGAFAFIPRGSVHRFACVSKTPGRILAIFTPGGMDGFFREAGRPAIDDGPAPPLDQQEIERTEIAARRYGLRVVSWKDAPAADEQPSSGTAA